MPDNLYSFNPLPHIPILGFSNLAPNDVKNMNKWGYNYVIG